MNVLYTIVAARSVTGSFFIRINSDYFWDRVSKIGWSDIVPLAIFEKRQVSADQVYF